MNLDFTDKDFLEAMTLYLSGQWREAKEKLTKLCEEYPESTFIRLLLGNTNYSLGKLTEALENYLQSVKINPEFSIAYYKAGVCAYRSGKLKEALSYFDKVIQLNGQSHAMASYFKGIINFFLGDDKNALDGFAELKDASKESYIANYYMAQLKIKNHDFDEAVQILEELIEVAPDFAEVYFLLGTAYYKLHKNMKAIKCFRKAQELNPTDKRSRNFLELLTDTSWP